MTWQVAEERVLVHRQYQGLGGQLIEEMSIHFGSHIDCKMLVLEDTGPVLVEEVVAVGVGDNVPYHLM
jgi:hypothetical protein